MTRLIFFLRIVWRPVTGDPGDTYLSAWIKYRMSLKTAWEISKTLHP